ncbi:hypothetical protein QTN25_002175 [Entamoeba marina]
MQDKATNVDDHSELLRNRKLKMIIIDTMTHRQSNQTLQRDDITKYSAILLQSLGYEHLNEKQMTLKQLKRSEEAQLNNGILYILKKIGFDFEEKKTKKAKCTERFLRIVSLKYQNVVLNKEKLMKFGSLIDEVVNENYNKNSLVLTKELFQNNICSDIPTVSLNSLDCLKDQTPLVFTQEKQTTPPKKRSKRTVTKQINKNEESQRRTIPKTPKDKKPKTPTTNNKKRSDIIVKKTTETQLQKPKPRIYMKPYFKASVLKKVNDIEKSVSSHSNISDTSDETVPFTLNFGHLSAFPTDEIQTGFLQNYLYV